MSKCPLQIYLNEKYLDSCQSVHIGNEGIKKASKDYIRRFLFQKNDRRSPVDNNKERNFTQNSVFNKYLAQHSKSIEAYYNLQRQQEEVLKLCKQKIAKHFPQHVMSELKDEDIIKALKIAESEQPIQSYNSNDKLAYALLKVIISSDNHHEKSETQDSTNDHVYKNEKCYRTEISVSECVNSKKKTVFGKIANCFIRPRAHAQKTYCTSSDNYFNNSKSYMVNGSADLVPAYPRQSGIKDHYLHYEDYKKNAFRQFLDKFTRDSWHSPKYFKSDNSSINSTSSKLKKKKDVQYLAYYCTNYQKDVDILKAEVKKQQNEITTIQTNLNRCLKLLNRFEEKSENQRNTHVFPVLTNADYGGFNSAVQPYARNYMLYRAEESHESQSGPSNSSNEAGKKCCCFRKKPKKNKAKKQKKCCKKKHSKQMQTASIPEAPPKPIEEKKLSEVKFTEEPPPQEPPPCTDEFETVKSSDEEPEKRKCCRRRKKKKKKEKCGKKKTKEDTKQPRKRNCCVRMCRVLFCSSCCV